MESATLALADFLVGPDYYGKPPYAGGWHAADERVQSWPLVEAKSAVLVSAAYVLGVPLGQWLMRDRKPFRLRNLTASHNLFMFSLSLWMVIETLSQASANFGWKQRFYPWANMTEPGKSFSPSGYRLARVIWVHYISKAYEFMDTLIMILRKKNNQISFLHVYHHASTFGSWWAAVNFAPGGDVYFICALNSFVHVCMYAYYLAASLGIRIGQPVKKSITILQMVQFGLLNTQAFYGVFWATWYRPRVVIVLAIIQSIAFMTLFLLFYRKAYGKRSSRNGAAAPPRSAAKAPETAAAAVTKAAAFSSSGDALGSSGKSSAGLRPRAGVNGYMNGTSSMNGHSLSHAL